MSWMSPGTQNFVAIGLGVSAPQIRDFAVPFDVTGRLRSLSGFFNKATAYTIERIFTQNTSNASFRVWGLDDYIFYLDP